MYSSGNPQVLTNLISIEKKVNMFFYIDEENSFLNEYL